MGGRRRTTTLWTTAENWEDDTLPAADDDVCIPTGAVSLDAARSVRSLTVSDGASLTVTAVTLAMSEASSNAGTVALSGGNAALRMEDGDVATTETLTNTGLITLSGDGSQLLYGDVANTTGTVRVDGTDGQLARNTEIRQPTFANGGTLRVSAGAKLSTTGVRVEQSGTIDGAGVLLLNTRGSHPRRRTAAPSTRPPTSTWRPASIGPAPRSPSAPTPQTRAARST